MRTRTKVSVKILEVEIVSKNDAVLVDGNPLVPKEFNYFVGHVVSLPVEADHVCGSRQTP